MLTITIVCATLDLVCPTTYIEEGFGRERPPAISQRLCHIRSAYAGEADGAWLGLVGAVVLRNLPYRIPYRVTYRTGSGLANCITNMQLAMPDPIG